MLAWSVDEQVIFSNGYRIRVPDGLMVWRKFDTFSKRKEHLTYDDMPENEENVAKDSDWDQEKRNPWKMIEVHVTLGLTKLEKIRDAMGSLRSDVQGEMEDIAIFDEGGMFDMANETSWTTTRPPARSSIPEEESSTPASQASPASSLPQGSVISKQVGLQTKNKRLSIPPDRTLDTTDDMIDQTDDVQEIRELQLQKRLLRESSGRVCTLLPRKLVSCLSYPLADLNRVDSKNRKPHSVQELEEGKERILSAIEEPENRLQFLAMALSPSEQRR